MAMLPDACDWVLSDTPPADAVVSSNKFCVVRSADDGTRGEIGKVCPQACAARIARAEFASLLLTSPCALLQYVVGQGLAKIALNGWEKTLNRFEFLTCAAPYEWITSLGVVPANVVL